jgi:hypothetical protein
MKGGLGPMEACQAAITQTLTEEAEVMESITDITKLYFGELMDDVADEPKADGKIDG